MSKFLVRGLALAFVVVAASHAAAAVIGVGTHVLVPNQAGQKIDINVSGADDVQGVVFNAQIADGYPDVSGSSIDGPNITGVDLLASGPIFGSVTNTGQNDLISFDQMWVSGTSVGSGTVAANGLLARLTIDTTGWSVTDGPWELKLEDTFNDDTNFQTLTGRLVPTVTNGWITFDIPEPSMFVVGSVLCLCGGAIWGSRRRRRTGT